MTAANVSQLPSPEPQDRKLKKKAREAEAGDGYLVVEQCGVELKIPIKGKIPLKAFMAFSSGDNLEGTKLLLGAEQWEAFLDKNPTLDDFEAIGDQLQELSGNQ